MFDTLKVVNTTTVKKAKNGREYKILTFAKQIIVPLGLTSTMINSSIVGKRIVWSEFTDDKGNFFKGDVAFNANVGDLFVGTIQKVNTTEYMVGENKVTSYTAVLFDTEMFDATSYINSQLKQVKACIVDENGVPTCEDNLKSEFAVV